MAMIIDRWMIDGGARLRRTRACAGARTVSPLLLRGMVSGGKDHNWCSIRSGRGGVLLSDDLTCFEPASLSLMMMGFLE